MLEEFHVEVFIIIMFIICNMNILYFCYNLYLKYMIEMNDL